MRPAVAALAVLATVSLAAPSAAQWVRPEGSNRSTIRRGDPPDRPPPMLGGIDLNAYCQSRGYYSARLDDSNLTWVCVSENGIMAIDMNDACRRAFGPDVRARQTSGSPMSWVCFGEVAPAETGPAPGNDARVAPAAPGVGETPGGAVPAAPAPAVPASPPAVQAPAAPAPAEPAPQTLVERITAPWTSLPFYARAVIAGLASLALGLLLGTMLRRKPGRED